MKQDAVANTLTDQEYETIGTQRSLKPGGQR